MTCRECGTQLDESNLLRNGAYQCPECGAIYHTANSSRTSPSPWRRGRKRGFAQAPGVLQRRLWVLPLWSWLAIALAVVVAVVILVLALSGSPADPSDSNVPAEPTAPVADDRLAADPTAQDDLPSKEDGNALPEPPAATSSNTGISVNDFVVSFDWAMSYLKYTNTLQLSSEEIVNGQRVRTYTYENWFDLRLTLGDDESVIQSAVATAGEDANDASNRRRAAAFVSLLYSFNNKLSATDGLKEINAMLEDNSRTYSSSSFTAKLSNGPSGSTLEITGTKQ